MKKGISSLIATVLIIGFVVVLAVAIITWGSSFFKSLKEQSESMAFESMSCASDVSISLKSACLIGNELIFLVENSGSKDFEGLLVRFYGGSGGDSVSIDEGLASFGIKKFSSSFDIEKVGELEKVEVFPMISFEGKTVFCSNNYDKIESIGECNLACENADPDFCEGLDFIFGEGYREMCCEEFKLCC